MSDTPAGGIDTRPARLPGRVTLAGKYVDSLPIDPARHSGDLAPLLAGTAATRLWAYMFDGPFADRHAFGEFLRIRSACTDPFAFAIVDKATGQACGMVSLMRIDTRHRVIEVGGIMFTPVLQRTRGATEAMYLLARYVFEDLGYRRYEWKCNALHTASRRAAERLGFTFEGVFRQHMIIKGRTRDTAWYSMLDSEWPLRRAEFVRWLAPENFDGDGQQKTPLRMG